MNNLEKKYVLSNLDEMSVENLKAGRITRQAMAFAGMKARKHSDFEIEEVGIHMMTNTADRILADVLNDMLEAARE